jgi:xylulokinase/glycerol kinase
MDHIIALDLGTSSMRALLYNGEGKVEVFFGHEYHSEFPRSGHVEQNPLSWRNAALDLLSRTGNFVREKGYAPLGIAVTSQRSSFIPMDARGNPLRSAIMWQDKRTIGECENLISEYGLQSLYRLTGLRINPYFVLPKICWFQKNQAGLYDRMVKILGVQDYVIHCLTGEYVTDYTQAGRTMLMNIEKFRWEDELLRIANIREDQLPRLVPPGSIAGGLGGEFAHLTGLPSGLPVVVSGGDQQNSAVALGLTKAGIAEANTGTGSFVLSCAEKAEFDESCRVLVQASAVAGKWVIEAGIFNTGSIYRWFKEQYCHDLVAREKPYAVMDTEAEKAGPGAHGVLMLPHFEGSAAPHWNPITKGLFCNLSLGTVRGDMLRAILEGIALEIQSCLDLLERLSGPINTVHAAGGMAGSGLFCQIQADCYGKTVIRGGNKEASSLGACIVAAPVLGLYNSLDQAYSAMAGGGETCFLPDSGQRALYQRLMSARSKLYTALAENGVYEALMDLL